MLTNPYVQIGVFMVLIVGLAGYLAFPAAPSDTDGIRDNIVRCLQSGESAWRSSCYRDLADRIFARMPLEEALASLAILDDEPGIRQTCHSLVHFLGQRGYEETRDLAGTFARCQSNIACGEGCYHGAVEAYIAETGNALTSETIGGTCKREDTSNEINYLACNHGLGHAFMLLYGSEIKPALESCDALQGEGERDTCYAGIFMENVFGFGSIDHPSLYIKTDDPSYPCTIVDERYRNACYESQSSFVIQFMQERYEGAARFCASVPKENQTWCYGGMGGDIVVEADDPADIRAVCGLAPVGEARDRCYKQALTFEIHGKAGEPRTLGAICASADEASTEQCYESAGEVLESWYPGGRTAQCGRITAEGSPHRAICVGSGT